MKNYIKRYCYIYVVINIILIVLSIVIKNRLNIDVPFVRLSIANIFVSIFITLAWTIFKIKKGNGFIKIIAGFIVILPVIALFRRAFGLLLFRASFAIYLFSLVVAIIYSLAVVIVSARAKKEEKELNLLINKDKDS